MGRLNWEKANMRDKIRKNGYINAQEEKAIDYAYKVLFAEARARAAEQRRKEFLARKEVVSNG
jgi:hypothetical protein